MGDDLLFTPDERGIFELPDGSRHDPLAVERALVRATGGKLDRINAILREDPHPDDHPDKAAQRQGKAEAEEMYLAAGRAAFNLAASPEVTDATVLDALDRFWEWLEKKGWPAASWPTSRPSSAGRPSR